MDKQNEANDLYNQWRKCIDELAGMDNSEPLMCAPIRTEALELGYKYLRKTGRNVALHVVR